MPRNSILSYRNAKLKVGLLGGSFNPAHQGHLHISNSILNYLKLDQIWWIVALRNPLKAANDMMDFDNRVKFADSLLKNSRIKISPIEKSYRSNYTIKLLRKLVKRFPKVQFIWIMGADNLVQFHKWYKWQEIAKLVPFIVFDRSPYSYKSMSSKSAVLLRKYWRSNSNVRTLASKQLPAWGFLRMKKHPLSSTEIRQEMKGIVKKHGNFATKYQ